MRAVVIRAKGDLRVEERPEPVPAPDEAVVRIAFGGVCGSDLHYWAHGAAGESLLVDPMVLGHEVVGTVAVAAADGSGPPVGTEVAVHPATPHPVEGIRYPLERPNLAPASTYLGSAARRPHTDGAFGEFAALPTRMLRPLPHGLDMRTAAIAEPAAVAWHALARAGDVRGARVLVIGTGPIGALAVAVARHHGAASIVAVDMHDLPLDIARAVGATETIRATDVDEISAVQSDVVIESSGNPRGLMSALRGAARGGRVVMVGLQPSGEQPALMSLAITRELELVGSFRFADEMDEVLAALADGSLETDAVVTHEFAVGESVAAFETALDPSRSGKVLIRF